MIVSMNTTQSAIDQFPALADMARGKDHLTTREFALAVRRKEGSVRKAYRIHGRCCGVTPIVVGRTLLWPVSDVVKVLQRRNEHGI
jgi:hypothetical protein